MIARHGARSAPFAAFALTLALAVSCAVAPAPGPSPSTASPAASAPDAVERELARLVHEHRARRGKPRLAWDEKLARVARRHSEDMARRGFFSHTNPDGRDPFERLSAAGIRYRAAAENIGEGYRDPAAMLAGWIASPGHRRNLESAEYTHHGIGKSGRYWTHVFVRYPASR